MKSLVGVSRSLSAALDTLEFSPPVTHVYDPTVHARAGHEAYLSLARSGIDALLVGMNPGPWGMVQTGVPFGEVAHVRDFLGIDEPVLRPANEHPGRPVLGLDCTRSEVSGRRLWSWVSDRFGTREEFFKQYFIWNWCPLSFMEESGRNRTPDKLSASERGALEPLCDAALTEVVELLSPRLVVGLGGFATRRARLALAGRPVEIGTVLHPSPASPAANRGWAQQAQARFIELGMPFPHEPVG